MREPFPLQWPEGWPRTKNRERSRFKVTSFARCRDELIHEIELLGGGNVIITSDMPVRADGLPYTGRRDPDDPGIAVYWHEMRIRGKTERVMACDRWDRFRDNMRAIQLSIAALRGLDRWGSSSLVDRAFEGFSALPAAGHDWPSVLGLDRQLATLELVKVRFRELAAMAHPDRGGNPHEMQRLNQAYEAAKMELGR